MLSRDLVIDACAVINLVKGEIALKCLSLIVPPPSVTPAVQSECEQKDVTATSFRELLDASVVSTLGEIITADAVIEFMEKYDLGAGESEGILVCIALRKHFWSDDRRARETAGTLISRAAVIGTAGVLRDLVAGDELPQNEVVSAYKLMRSRGGFLPKFPDEFFCKSQS